MANIVLTEPSIQKRDSKVPEEEITHSYSEWIVIPADFINCPFYESGIGHLISEGQNVRVGISLDKKMDLKVRNPISVAGAKVIFLMLGKKQKKFSYTMDFFDFMELVANTKNRKFLKRVIQSLKKASISLSVKDPGIFGNEVRFVFNEKKKVFTLEGGENCHIVKNCSWIIKGRKKYLKVDFEENFLKFYFGTVKRGYVRVRTDVLREITNKHSVELQTYLLVSKYQTVHTKDFLIPYYLNCTEGLLSRVKRETQIRTIINTIGRINKRIIKALEKMKILRVISDFQVKEGKILVGGKWNAPFVERLEITPYSKNPTT